MKNTLLPFFILILTGYTTLSQQSAIFQTNGKAISGYDVVAYFTEGKPVKGNDSLTYQWSNSSWLFTSLTNLELFKQNPEQYVPQYGGYCAYGTASGYKAPTQPVAWAIVNGKLYFNYNLKIKANWDMDRVGYISKADINWPLIKDK